MSFITITQQYSSNDICIGSSAYSMKFDISISFLKYTPAEVMCQCKLIDVVINNKQVHEQNIFFVCVVI